jgi:hypothetical protein
MDCEYLLKGAYDLSMISPAPSVDMLGLILAGLALACP